MQWLMRIVLGVATLFLLIMSAIVGAGAYQDSTELHAIKTKQIQQNERATAQAKQTAAALIKLAPGVYPSYLPGKGKPVFADPLGQPGIWDNGKNNDGTGECLFTDGVYRASSTAAKSFYACVSHLALSNFAFEVEMTVIEGDCGGALFRADTRSLKSYMFEVCRSGIIALYKYKDNTGKNVTTLVARQENNAVHVGLNQSNLLAVVARGSEISLFVNQQLVATVQDKDYTQGDIELFADDFTGPTRVLFKNVKVWAF